MKTYIVTCVTLIAAWLVLFSVAQTAMAQAPVNQPYDLAAVVARALAANPSISAARQEVAAAEARARDAAASRSPRVQAEAGYLLLGKDPSFTVAPMGTLVFGTTENPYANLSLDWPIYSGGAIEAIIAASRKGVDAAWQGYARTRQEIAAEAGVAYYQAHSARRMIDVMREQIATLTEAVRVANGLHAQGMVAKLDVLRPTTDLAAAQAAMTQAENGYQLALTNLRRLMNLPAAATIELAQPAAAALPVMPATDDAIAQALAQRPEMKQLRASREAVDAQRRAALGAQRPHIGLHAQYDIDRPSTYPDTGDWSLALVLRQSLLDGGSARAQRDEATAQRELLRSREEALRQGITMQVTNALLTLQAARKRAESAALAQATAEEAFRAAEVSYRNQVVPMIDVLGAQTALTNARVQLALAEFEQQTALVQYRLALGDAPEV